MAEYLRVGIVKGSRTHFELMPDDAQALGAEGLAPLEQLPYGRGIVKKPARFRRRSQGCKLGARRMIYGKKQFLPMQNWWIPVLAIVAVRHPGLSARGYGPALTQRGKTIRPEIGIREQRDARPIVMELYDVELVHVQSDESGCTMDAFLDFWRQKTDAVSMEIVSLGKAFPKRDIRISRWHWSQKPRDSPPHAFSHGWALCFRLGTLDRHSELPKIEPGGIPVQLFAS